MTAPQIEQVALSSAGSWFRRLSEAVDRGEDSHARLFAANAVIDALTVYAEEIRKKVPTRG